MPRRRWNKIGNVKIWRKRRASYSIQKIKRKGVSRETKIRLYKTVVPPTVTYCREVGMGTYKNRRKWASNVREKNAKKDIGSTKEGESYVRRTNEELQNCTTIQGFQRWLSLSECDGRVTYWGWKGLWHQEGSWKESWVAQKDRKTYKEMAVGGGQRFAKSRQ